MDVKPANAQTSITARTAYQRSPRVLQHTDIPSPPVSPDDIIGCVEIETGKPLPANIHIAHYKPLNNYPSKKKERS